jgi:hypothetical protein
VCSPNRISDYLPRKDAPSAGHESARVRPPGRRDRGENKWRMMGPGLRNARTLSASKGRRTVFFDLWAGASVGWVFARRRRKASWASDHRGACASRLLAPRAVSSTSRRPDRPPLDPSGPPVADGDPAIFQDHGNLADALRMAEHLLQVRGRPLNIAVIDPVASAGEGLTGLGGVGSVVLSVDHDPAVGAHAPVYRPRGRGTGLGYYLAPWSSRAWPWWAPASWVGG